MLPQSLGPVEVRVLGSLIEKELTTPDHYPLSLNALMSACNQTTNREPVTAFDEQTVSDAITVLRRLGFVRSFQGAGERVPKYQHLLEDTENLSRAERAVLGVLLLRGPQTSAELRTRTERMIGGEDANAVDVALAALIAREPAAAATLPRRAGQKEVRHAHLLAGDVTYETPDAAVAEKPTDRVSALEDEVRELRGEVTDLRAQLEAFRKQFE